MRMYFFFLLVSFNVFAATTDWIEVKIPGAKCGDGQPYSVLVQKRNSNKLLVEFMGGGVCWNYESCFEKSGLFPWLHPYPVIKSYSVLTANSSTINPFKEHSKIYFPYCTGDVHAGEHVSKYKNKIVYHYGKRNIEYALDYLKMNNLFNFEEVNDLVVSGSSAGGIATILHGKLIESYVESNAKKTMIVDSAGLHFGETFWSKFDNDMKIDFKDSFNKINLDVDFNDGAVSKKMGPVFDYYHDWEIGFIFALEDSAMSKTYGNITPKDYRKLLLSSDGVPYIAKNYSNVNIWMRDTSMHTFLLTKYTASLRSLLGIPVYQFVENLYKKSL